MNRYPSSHPFVAMNSIHMKYNHNTVLLLDHSGIKEMLRINFKIKISNQMNISENKHLQLSFQLKKKSL
jgi:hypothetical protein